jgi:hypothetical protein
VVGNPDAAQRTVRRRRGLDRLGARSRLAGDGCGGLPDRFAHTLRRVDRLQPALLVVCLSSTIAFASSTGGAARTLAALAAGGFLVVLVGSVAWLVPLQRRLVASGSAPPPADVEALRAQWLGGHLLRSAVALACFVLAVVATVV